jgi:hypothetical protein
MKAYLMVLIAMGTVLMSVKSFANTEPSLNQIASTLAQSMSSEVQSVDQSAQKFTLSNGLVCQFKINLEFAAWGLAHCTQSSNNQYAGSYCISDAPMSGYEAYSCD